MFILTIVYHFGGKLAESSSDGLKQSKIFRHSLLVETLIERSSGAARRKSYIALNTSQSCTIFIVCEKVRQVHPSPH